MSVSPRIVIIGSSCAGKSTLAAAISEQTGLTHTQLDELHWLPDWVARDTNDFSQRVSDAAAKDRWVIDGNYKVVRPLLWRRATLIIWLNYSFPRVLWRSLKRSVHRIVTREVLYAGNRETFRKTFLSRDSIIWWVMTTFHEKRRRYEVLLQSDAVDHCEVLEFRHPHDAQALLNTLSAVTDPESPTG